MDGGQTPNPHNMIAMQRILRKIQQGFEVAITAACPSLPEPATRAHLLGSTAIEWVMS